MVMAGLAGASSHMVSATISALAHLLYEFHGRCPSADARLSLCGSATCGEAPTLTQTRAWQRCAARWGACRRPGCRRRGKLGGSHYGAASSSQPRSGQGHLGLSQGRGGHLACRAAWPPRPRHCTWWPSLDPGCTGPAGTTASVLPHPRPLPRAAARRPPLRTRLAWLCALTWRWACSRCGARAQVNGLLTWPEEHRRRFRDRSKHILMRLIRKFG